MSTWLYIELCSYSFGLLIVALCIYHNLELWSRRNEMFIRKRHKLLVFLLNGSFIYVTISFYILTFGHWFGELGIFTAGCNLFVALWFLFFILILKNWMIYYKYHWTLHTMEAKWQNIINPTKHAQNWFIKNNIKYGNISYMFKYIGSWCLLGLIIGLIPWILAVPFKFAIFVLILLIIFTLSTFVGVIIIYGYIVKKTPNIDDIFQIHWESKMQAKLLIIFGITIAFVMILGAIFTATLNNDSSVDTHDNGHKSWIMYPMVFAVIFCRMNYVSSKSISKNNAYYEELRSSMGSSSMSCLSERYMVEIQPEMEAAKKIQIDMVLSNEVAIHAFMTHLSREYSMECLLSIIEIQQYQNYILEHVNDGDITTTEAKMLSFPSNVPISAIIEKEDDQKVPDAYNGDEFLFYAKIKAHKLFTKYISTSCEHEINISFAERCKLIEKLENVERLIMLDMNAKDLFWIFYNSKKSMLLLIDASFYRFKKSEEFAKIISVFEKV